MQSSGYQSANHLTEKLQNVQYNIKQIKESQATVISSLIENDTVINEMMNHIGHQYYPPGYTANDTNPVTDNTTPQANAATQSSQELQSFMQSMKRDMTTLTKRLNTVANQNQPPSYSVKPFFFQQGTQFVPPPNAPPPPPQQQFPPGQFQPGWSGHSTPTVRTQPYGCGFGGGGGGGRYG